MSSSLEPIPDRPGILSCGELRLLNLGILKGTTLVGCLKCTDFFILSFSTCAAHVHKHMENARDISTRQIQEILRKYGVFEDLVSEYPRPDKLITPYPCLPIRDAWSCNLCYERNPFFGTSTKGRDNHFQAHHTRKFAQRGQYETLVRVQTYASGWNNNSYLFEVSEALAVDVAEDAPYVTRPATVDELAQTMKDRFTVASEPASTGITLKDTQPALYWTGWAAHVNDHDPEFLRLLVEYPIAQTATSQADLLWEFAEEVQQVFYTEQREVDQRSGILRKLLVDTGKGSQTEFKKLDSTVVASYAQLLSRWACFVLRLYQRQTGGTNNYRVFFTKRQTDACVYALQWCHSDRKARDLGVRYILLRMARSFWAPEHLEESFQHLEKDQLDDPTTRFACLINLKPDGTFQSPNNMSHNLTMIKYIIRQTLLAWCVDRADELTRTGKPSTAHSVLVTLGPALADDQLTPFAHICLASSHAARYAKTSTHLPNVMWTSRTALSVDGSAVDFDGYRGMLSSRLNRLEELVLGDGGLLMGLCPTIMDFNVTEKTHIHDNFSETRLGYSFLTDPNNPFAAMRFNLINAIFKHRPGRLASGIHKSSDGKASITWIERAVSEWLDIYDECILEICTLIHAVGGQPARGVESCLLKLVNTPYRVRGVYAWRAGILVFVLLYSKTTSMTGRDRVVAHAVPWRIGRLFLIINALARPLAGILIERSRGPLARAVQETSAFPIRGVEITSDQLSDRLREWFVRELGVSLGIRAFRHFVIACQRKLMPEAFALIQEAMAVVDTQAGHTSTTGTDIYAIDAAEIHMLSTTTVLKSVFCSLRWAGILFPTGVLTEEENSDALSAGQVIKSNNSNSSPNSLSKSDLVEAVKEAFRDEGLVDLLCQRMGQHVVNSIVASRALGTNFGVNNFRAATRLIEAKHSVLLQRYQNNPQVTWRSGGQAQAIVHILARESSLLVVLPTGGGKSFLFGSLPLIESGVTLVLFPLVALYTDQVRESKEHHNLLIRSGRQLGRELRIWEWEPGLVLTNHIGLVGVSVDIFIRTEFQAWFTTQLVNKRINRVIFDEVHTAVTQSGFRDCMTHLQDMTRQGVPIVGLSATMPPSLEDSLCTSLGRPTFAVIRESTQRPNIEYHIARYSSNREAKIAFTKQVKHFETLLKPREGLLVICRTNPEVSTWAKSFGTYGYSSNVKREDADEATRMLNEWTSGKIKILVGTTAVGTGVNHKHVRCVFHWGPPYGPADFQQESGRAGRDGRPAASMIFWSDPRLRHTGASPRGEAEIDRMLDGDECVRLTLSKWIDGEDLASSCSGGVGFRRCFRCKSAHQRALDRDGVALSGPQEHVPTNQTRMADELVLDEIPRDAMVIEDVLASSMGGDGVDIRTNDSNPATDPPFVAIDAQTELGVAVLPPLLEPPARIGGDVVTDQHAADTRAGMSGRQVTEIHQVYGPTVPVTRALPFCLDALVKAKKYLLRKCIWCILIKKFPADHDISTCNGALFTTWEMEGFNYLDYNLGAAKTNIKFPRSAGICFYCWWPSSVYWDHKKKPKDKRTDCDVTDPPQQIVWWYLCDNARRKRLVEFFGIVDKSGSIELLFQWLSEAPTTETKGGNRCAFTNAQRVVIWVLYIDLKVCDYNPSV